MPAPLLLHTMSARGLGRRDVADQEDVGTSGSELWFGNHMRTTRDALVDRSVAGDVVAAEIDGAVLGAANLAEVVSKLVDADLDVARLRQLLGAAGVVIESLSAVDAELAGAMRLLDGGRHLSLGDRCGLALTVRSTPRGRAHRRPRLG